MKKKFDKMNLLIGSSGFVGSTLRAQTHFDFLYNSHNIASIKKEIDGVVVCAGAPSQKWIANRNPSADLKNIKNLIVHLKSIRCVSFILISTVDVFKIPNNVDENSRVDEDGLNPYGLHRRMLENFVENNFKNHLIVRLSGLVGPGLRKNIIFDFLNNNNLDQIDSRSVYQFYPMVNLWRDIQIILNEKINLVHFTAEPITVADVSKFGFDKIFNQKLSSSPVNYDMRTRYAKLFGAKGHYQYSRHESIQAIRAYAKSETKKSEVKNT